MWVKSLKLQNFRNFETLFLDRFEERNVIYGENAQGKTNLLEGIWLFTGAKSFRGAKDEAFVRFGTDGAKNEMTFLADGIENEAVLQIKEHRLAQLNGNKCKTPAALAGSFSAVVFSPADLSLVEDGPAVRRRFLDTAIGMLSPSYIACLRDYVKALTQRNKIIKEYKYDPSLTVMLDVFEEELALSGAKLITARKKFCKSIKNYLPGVYEGISCGKETLEADYVCGCGEDDLKERLLRSRKEDMITGATSVGPHRDDLSFFINGISARNYGSQGQKRSASLAVKLAQAEVIREKRGELPVFLLDDVMSELDPGRQNYILNHIKGIQSFLTCCDPTDIQNLKEGKVIKIQNGSVAE